jgi:hypothetical protein
MSKSSVIDFVTMFIVQLAFYTILCINYRAVAQANILWSVISDFFIASMNFLIIRKIAKSGNSMVLFWGYGFGSAVGSVVGIVVSKMILSH